MTGQKGLVSCFLSALFALVDLVAACRLRVIKEIRFIVSNWHNGLQLETSLLTFSWSIVVL
jgi:hypothetical protein